MTTTPQPAVSSPVNPLLTDLRGLIEAARSHVAQTANATLTMLYWHIGQRIGVELLQKERAPYGQEIVSAVSRQLTLAYGKGFILADMERFLLEMGDGFCFVARQKRLIIGADDFYIDLLFYHRKLRRLVAVELKLERFQAAHKGQMELYLRWLDKYERQSNEETPIGLILCASVNREEVEVLQLDGSSIRVAEYLTELPEREALRLRLHHAIELAREQATHAALATGNAEGAP